MSQPPLPGPREWYGKANGPGPLHILSDDRSAVLCGRTRFHLVHRRDVSTSIDEVCKQCEVAERRPPPISAEVADAAYAEAVTACDAMAAARAQLLESLRLLHQARSSPHLNEALTLAVREGISRKRLAHELGISPQALHMRLRRSPSR